MPLVRNGDNFSIRQDEGVTFAMRDTATGERVLCRVPRESLDDRASFDGRPGEWSDMWRKHREYIEALASANYDNSSPRTSDGAILVTTLDLTPLAHAPPNFQPRQ